MKLKLLLVSTLSLLFGCVKRETATKDIVPTTHQITANTLAKGIGVQWWVVEAPVDITESDYAGLGYRSHDGTEHLFGASDGWDPKEKAYIFFEEDKNGVPTISIVRDSISAPKILDRPKFQELKSRAFMANDSHYKFGEIFAKLGTGEDEENFSDGAVLHENQIGFFVDIVSEK